MNGQVGFKSKKKELFEYVGQNRVKKMKTNC